MIKALLQNLSASFAFASLKLHKQHAKHWGICCHSLQHSIQTKGQRQPADTQQQQGCRLSNSDASHVH